MEHDSEATSDASPKKTGQPIRLKHREHEHEMIAKDSNHKFGDYNSRSPFNS
jgi:hypothetical protein